VLACISARTLGIGCRMSSRPSPLRSPRAHEWNDDDFDVLADGAVVGRILKAATVPVGTP